MMKAKSGLFLFILSAGVFACADGCRLKNDAETHASGGAATLAPYQQELLDLAFGAASAMPVFPHAKNRARAQEVVVIACLELDQPERARQYIEQIGNWRRGAGYADLALHYARHGATDQVEPCLALASQTLEQAEGWRKDRIKAKMAAARVYLGQAPSAAEQGVALAEWGPVARAEALAIPADAFEAQMADLGKLISAQEFDVVKAALGGYVELYRRFFPDRARRTQIEEKIEASWDNMPVFVRIELLMELIDAALTHTDPDKALELINEAQALMAAARWQPRFVIPLMAQLAERRFHAGDETGARAEVQRTLALFNGEREKIVNIYRAQTLRPIAEAVHAMGDAGTTLNLYRRALEAGQENPNSRPRTDDLVATCCSLAVRAVEPDEALMNRIRDIRAGLGDPW